MFGTRYCLHKQVYTHTVVKAIELMIGDILIYADDEFAISTTLKEKDMSKYMYFTDSLLHGIQRSPYCLV
jgi:HD superfamily phosphohydrolase